MTDSPYPASKREKEYLVERQELAIEFLFCLVLIEVLTKLSVHPVPESFIHTIEDYAFKHFKMQEALKDRYTSSDVHTIIPFPPPSLPSLPLPSPFLLLISYVSLSEWCMYVCSQYHISGTNIAWFPERKRM